MSFVANFSSEDLTSSLHTAFVDYRHEDKANGLRAQFLSNRKTDGGSKVVLNAIIDELKRCESFDISVAFITDGGLCALKLTLAELREKGIRGRILTTDYNTFSTPSALRQLDAFDNIEVRMFCCSEAEGFHTKGYIFNHSDHSRIILGSSNLTQSALSVNCEWNIKLISAEDGEIARCIKSEFDLLWERPESRKLSDVIDDYESAWKAKQQAARLIAKSASEIARTPTLRPNSMQRNFIEEILKLYRKGERRALLISATGTGKTYAAAFAVRRLMGLSEEEQKVRPAPKRILFLVHREQIARQAKKSFAAVLGGQYTYGILSGTSKETRCDFTFATMQTMSKPAVMEAFGNDYFDLIVIDEVHRAGADSYKRIMGFFKPQFWLGMTASPDRTDGEDIYGMFDNNIAYEIRLQTALSENLLCPFHYYGLSDLRIDGEEAENPEDFNRLNLTDRVDHILKQADYFRYSGDRVKGLIFCSTKEECRSISLTLNQRNLNTCVLTGDDSQEKREEAIRKLTTNEPGEHLDYILSVDIFNEGVDIPEINQVIFLRPTMSPIVFIQQLGRGLRKAEGKEYVVILDFIANYKSNYLIPIALSGDNSYDKDNMRRFVAVGARQIPGASTIEFENVVKKRIFEAIDSAKTSDISLIRDSYSMLRFKLGRIPKLTDFEEHNAIDPIKIFAHKSFLSYHGFLKKYEKSYKTEFTTTAEKMLCFLSNKLGRAQRIEEAQVIRTLADGYEGAIRKELKSKHGIVWKKEVAASVFNVLSNNFNRTDKEKQDNEKYLVFLRPLAGDTFDFAMSDLFKKTLEENGEAFRSALFELCNFIEQRFSARYAERYLDTNLTLYEKYTYEDVCRLLNWKRNLNAQNIGGYFYDKESKTLPVFVNYEKEDEAIAYEDRFESERLLIALSKTKRQVTSSDADHIYKRCDEDKQNRIYLFVRRNKDDQEAKAFYFLGEIEAEGTPLPVELPGKDENSRETAFEIRYRLETPVRGDIYEYLTGV